MRESSKIDKTHLPVDSYEAWLKNQSGPTEKGGQQRTPAEESYETWMDKRVERELKEGSGRAKRAHRS